MYIYMCVYEWVNHQPWVEYYGEMGIQWLSVNSPGWWPIFGPTWETGHRKGRFLLKAKRKMAEK